MDLSMSIIHDDHEPDKTLESTSLDGYQLTDLPMKQPDESSHEHTGVGMALTLETGSTTELAPREGSSTQLRSGVDPCQWCSLSSPLLTSSWRK